MKRKKAFKCRQLFAVTSCKILYGTYPTLPVKLIAARSGDVVILLPNTGPEQGTKFKMPTND